MRCTWRREYRSGLSGEAEARLSGNPRDELGLAIDYASRGSIRRDLKQFSLARADITAVLAWFERELPGDVRSIGICREILFSINVAERL